MQLCQIVSNIWQCFPPWSWFRLYRLLFHFWPSYCIWTGVNQTRSVIRKNMAAHWHCCGSVNHSTVSFSKNALMRWKANDEWLSQTKTWGRKRGGGGGRWEERSGRAESRLYCCQFSHRQQQRKWNGAAKYTNRTMRQWAWSSCGTWLSPGSGVWNTDDRLF